MSDPCLRRSAGCASSLGLHVVWRPKHRLGLLGGRVTARLNELLDEIAGENDWQILAREAMPDHVRIFLQVRPCDSPAEVVRQVKGRSIQALRARLAWLGRRRALFGASAGYVSEQTVRRCIEHQWDKAA